MMNYQHFNSVIGSAYKDLQSSTPFPAEFLKDVVGIGCSEYFLNRSIPGAFTYFTLMGRESRIAVFADIQKKQNCTSEARYSQYAGWELTPQLLRDGMESILRCGFFTEEKLDSYGSGIVADAFGLAEAPGSIRLDKTALKAVFVGVMNRWHSGASVVRIAVPEGVDYNEYVFSAANEIYRYFPVGLRAAAGFCSYLPKEAPNVKSIFIGFVPEKEAASLGAIYLDCSKPVPDVSMRMEPIEKLIDCLIESDAAQRRELIEFIYECIENDKKQKYLKKTEVMSYYQVMEAVDIIRAGGTTESAVKRWIDFSRKQSNYPPELSKRIRESFTERITEDDIAGCFEADCRQCSSNEKLIETAQRYDLISREYSGLSGRLEKVFFSVLEGMESAESDKLIGMLEQSYESVSGIVSAGKLDELRLGVLYKAVREEYEKLPWQTPDQLNERAAYLQKKKSEAEKFSESELKAEYINYLEKCRQDNDTIRNDSLQKYFDTKAELEKNEEYFSAVERYCEIINGSEIALDQERTKQLEEVLSRKRPAGIKNYIAEYKRYYGASLTARSLEKRPPMISDYIKSDLNMLRVREDSVSLEYKSKDYAENEHAAEALASKIEADAKEYKDLPVSSRFNIKVSIDNKVKGKETDILNLIRLERLPKSDNSMELLRELVHAKLFSGSDISDLLRMLKNADEDELESAVRWMLKGYFTKGDITDSSSREKLYRSAFDKVLTEDGGRGKKLSAKGKKIVKKLSQMNFHTEEEKYFNRWKEQFETGPNKKLIIGIALGVLAAAILAAGTTMIVKLTRGNSEKNESIGVLEKDKTELQEDNRSKDQHISELEKQVESYKNEAGLFEKDISEYEDVFRTVSLNEENSQTLENFYSKLYAEQKLSDKQKIAAFFWGCVYAGEEQAVTGEDLSAVLERKYDEISETLFMLSPTMDSVEAEFVPEYFSPDFSAEAIRIAEESFLHAKTDYLKTSMD